MCGIVGYIGEKQTDKILIELLKRLEYRGYDSAGIASLCNNEINVTKSVGKICDLEKLFKPQESTVGIAHTRWATHGKPSYSNAHPFLSDNNEWAIVHNGIIENYANLKNNLQEDGVNFDGETDSEVIAKMLGKTDGESNIKKLINVCAKLNGSYALACINKHQNNTIYLAKNKSPLYVAIKNEQVIASSDVICFSGKIEEYYEMLDGEFCEVNSKNITFFNKNGEKIAKNAIILQKIDYSDNKNGYKHFMIKEIYESKNALKNLAQQYKMQNPLLNFNKKFLNSFDEIVLIGCGTAYHASLMGEKYFNNITRVKSRAYVASEYRYSSPIITEKTLCILISQSGETADTLAVCEMAKKCDATTIAITNVEHSALAKMSDYVLPICAGPEMAVASTKAYTAQLAVLYMFACYIKNVLKNKNINYIYKIENLAEKINHYNQTKIKKLATEIKDQNKAFFIGRNYDYVTSEEASLKLKEISYINSSAHPAGELKHGFLALIESGTYVFALATNKKILDKTLNGASEAAARGAKVILITQQSVPKEKLKNMYKVIKLKKVDENLMPIVSVIYFQELAYYVSLSKNLNPDQPRNLAKSVTVE